MDKLFLAVIETRTTFYMEDRGALKQEFTRLVWGRDYEDAKAKVMAAFHKPDPYGTSKTVEHLELHEAIA